MCSLAPAPPSLSTPLGTLGFSASFDQDDVTTTVTQLSYRLDGDAILHVWTAPALRAELLIIRPRITLLPGLAVADCWAAMWRVRALAPTGRCAFACAWEADSRAVHRGPATGQFLDAQAWSDGEMEVMIGTPDGEALLTAARAGEILPSRWASRDLFGCRNADCVDMVRHTATGFEIPLPGLEAGEQCQVHFGIAWAPDDDDDATWSAVNLTPQQILSGLAGG